MTRVIQVPVEPMTAEAFRPFGEILGAPGDPAPFRLGTMETWKTGFEVDGGVEMTICRYRREPIEWSRMERHLAVTQAFIKEDDFLIHANVGVSTVSVPGLDPAKVTWGVGTQVETVFDVHLVGEIFSGDPYVQGAGAAYQAGFRIIFDEHLQLDGTWGGGLWGESPMPIWL